MRAADAQESGLPMLLLRGPVLVLLQAGVLDRDALESGASDSGN